MLEVFVGSSERYKDVEHCIFSSIKANTTEEFGVRMVHPADLGLDEKGCTGFTNIRFTIPWIMTPARYAIYLDVDMLVLADIAELLQYAQKGKWVCLEDGSTEVMIIDMMAPFDLPPTAPAAYGLHKSEAAELVPLHPAIPKCWNCEAGIDEYVEGETKLIHFTDLKDQPYFRPRNMEKPEEAILNKYLLQTAN